MGELWELAKIGIGWVTSSVISLLITGSKEGVGELWELAKIGIGWVTSDNRYKRGSG
jgi:hypothetical protein